MRVTMLKFSLYILIISLTCFSNSNFASDNYSIYLVRHAEKKLDSDNPSLTQCGLLRAKLLASMLSKTTIKSIYSTSYQRTMQTAKPSANLHNLPIKNYSPKHLDQLATQLKQRKETALIVGHSNTTPMLTELLSKTDVKPLTEQEYQYLYQVQFFDNQTVLTILQQPLECEASQKHQQ